MIQQKQVDYAKELDDVLVAIVRLVQDIKLKKPVGDIAADALSNVVAAVSGLDQLPVEEQSRKVFLETIGYRVGDLADSLLP